MSYFKIYLKKHIKSLTAFILMFAVFAVSFFLYKLPVKAVVYPYIVCIVLGFVYFVTDYGKEKSKYESLLILKEIKDITLSDIDMLAGECENEDLIKILCNQKNELLNTSSEKYSDMIEYYTVWAHQIKTPIASMRLNLQNEDTPLSRRLETDLFRIEQYVEMVLTYLRLDSSSTDYVIKKQSADPIIRTSVKKFAGDFINKKLKLEFSETGIETYTDEKWLGFVIEQIILNSVKYTPEGGKVRIYSEDGKLCISDNGIGILPEDIPRVFEKGYTGFNGREDKKASGIGLYLSGRICKNLGHNIRIYSEDGNGTTVKIDLYKKELEIE